MRNLAPLKKPEQIAETFNVDVTGWRAMSDIELLIEMRKQQLTKLGYGMGPRPKTRLSLSTITGLMGCDL